MAQLMREREATGVRAGWLCFAGALIGVAGGLVTAFYPAAVSTDRYSYPYPAAGYLLAQASFVVNHVLLLIGIVGLGQVLGGRDRLGVAGVWTAGIGMVALTLCEFGSMSLVHAAADSSSVGLLGGGYGLATVLIGVGLILAGVAVLRSSGWRGWRRVVTLACGVAVFVVVIPGLLVSELAGRLVLSFWMLLFAAFGLALAAGFPLNQRRET